MQLLGGILVDEIIPKKGKGEGFPPFLQNRRQEPGPTFLRDTSVFLYRV